MKRKKHKTFLITIQTDSFDCSITIYSTSGTENILYTLKYQ